ncbi:hypothetical protein WJX73_000412 [Symbiochloris irregularis]|uniref:3-oxoacyl-[acyl-carrier-protein] synthase I, chloroplastic n=1 Tax=Symbiochloris irregularis TaxID=706552 RepID=A0AAW1P6A2_9CHLO
MRRTGALNEHAKGAGAESRASNPTAAFLGTWLCPRPSPQCRRKGDARCPQRLVILAAGSNGKAGRDRRVVVTGQGIVSCLGHDVDTFYNNLLAGTSGVGHIDRFDTEGMSTRFAGQIKEFSCSDFVERKMERRLDDTIKYIIVSGKNALEDAGLDWRGEGLSKLDRMRCGVLMGTAMGGMHTFTTAVEDLTRKGFKRMNPFCIPFAINNMGGALLAMDLGFMGPNYSISTACATGNFCILSAAEHIRRGEADIMLAGGADAAIIPSGMGGFIACKALSQNNSSPEKASRPWDKGRDGFVMGEGAGALVLEDLEHAQRRGAPILAEFIGGAFTCDAHHLTEPLPDGSGVALCLERAIQQSGVSPEEIDYVNAHATSTKAGDMAEYKALRRMIPGDKVRMNSTKGMIGHLLGAAGAVEAIASIQAIRTGELHPNVNLEDPEEGVDLNILVGAQKQKHEVKVALSNSFGFGGHNSSILFRSWRE